MFESAMEFYVQMFQTFNGVDFVKSTFVYLYAYLVYCDRYMWVWIV